MIYSPQDLLGTTESLLKYDEDERLSEASPQHLHNALGRAVMIAVGDNWAKSRARRAGKAHAAAYAQHLAEGALVAHGVPPGQKPPHIGRRDLLHPVTSRIFPLV